MNPSTPTQPVDSAEELVYAAAVLILSHDLYPRKLEVVREYIQNASDAIDAFSAIADLIEDTSEPVVKISIQGRSLLIFDNGIGMDAEDVSNLRRIAYSEKKAGEEAGYKGIGRLAGIAVADKLKISSTSYGDSKLHHFEFRASDMREDVSQHKKQGIQEPATVVINRHTTLWSTPIDPRDHYTIVEIRGISEKWSELLDAGVLKEYIGDIAPVDFSPEFTWGQEISQKLVQSVPDYSPKKIYLSMPNGERVRVFKPYVNSMSIAKPDYQPIRDPANPNRPIALCWYAPKGEQILGSLRPVGRIFSVDGSDKQQKTRYAGMVYKLFGFSIGDRNLPLQTLWGKSFPRALWFTGEIHIVDKDVLPTTDRSNFIENDARNNLFKAATDRIPKDLNNLAQQISNDRNAFHEANKFRLKLQEWENRLLKGQIEKSELKSLQRELYENQSKLRERAESAKDTEIKKFDKEVQQFATRIQKELEQAKTLKGNNSIADVALELQMTSKARRVFQIVMDTLQDHYANDPQEYYEVAAKIAKALRKKYA
ncbi:MAG: ATP-binding protein [Candidatus Acidiferrum sp.]